MKYRYTAKSISGQTVKGRVEATNVKAAAELVREQQLIPISLKPEGNSWGISSIRHSFGRVSANDVANFTRQLSTMMTAGLPLTDALNLLKSQSTGIFAPIITSILLEVQSGVALSVAMSKHPQAFSPVYVALVKAGESAGIMEKILSRLADTTEKSREFRGKVIGAMIYPIIIIMAMFGVVAIMMLFVVPKLTELYADFGAELPFATRALMMVSDFSVRFWWLIVIVILGLFFGIRGFLSTEEGQSQFGKLIYKLPVVGQLSQRVTMTELTRTLALLLGAGIGVVEALNIVAAAIGNINVKREVYRISKRVEKGFPVSISFAESESFPPLVGQMMAVGEETGKMDEVLNRLSLYFESESSESIKGLTTAIEPIILMILAVGVGFLMYAVIMPMYGVMNKI